jgi:hypothetical protein
MSLVQGYPGHQAATAAPVGKIEGTLRLITDISTGGKIAIVNG